MDGIIFAWSSFIAKLLKFVCLFVRNENVKYQGVK